MKIAVEKFNGCIGQYIEYLIAHANKRRTQFKLGLALGSGIVRLDGKYLDMAREFGVVVKDGAAEDQVDIDRLKELVKCGFDASGGEVDVPGGLTFDRDDATRFFGLLETGKIAQ